MLFRKVMAVCSQNPTKNIAPRGENWEFISLTASGISYSYATKL